MDHKIIMLQYLVFSERRQRLLPKNLEIVLFLKFNRNLWTPFTVQEVYKDIIRQIKFGARMWRQLSMR